MIKRELQTTISIEHVLAVLNEAVKLDPEAMTKFCLNRVPCNQALAGHPTIQVVSETKDDNIENKVGFLGVLNGLFGISKDGWGAIAGVFDFVCPNGHSIPSDAPSDRCPECGEKLNFMIVKFFQVRHEGD